MTNAPRLQEISQSGIQISSRPLSARRCRCRPLSLLRQPSRELRLLKLRSGCSGQAALAFSLLLTTLGSPSPRRQNQRSLSHSPPQCPRCKAPTFCTPYPTGHLQLFPRVLPRQVRRVRWISTRPALQRFHSRLCRCQSRCNRSSDISPLVQSTPQLALFPSKPCQQFCPLFLH